MPVPIHDAGFSPTREPIAVYRELSRTGLLHPDPAQQLAIERLQSLYRALLDYRPETGLHGWLARFGLTENGNAHAPMGLYLCGPVGCGKSIPDGVEDLLFPCTEAHCWSFRASAAPLRHLFKDVDQHQGLHLRAALMTPN